MTASLANYALRPAPAPTQVALHYVFNTPEDPVIFDVSHQVYPHKILTGRRSRMPTLRQHGGLSGFAKRAESVYDTFGAGHSTTSISAALGMAVAHELQGLDKVPPLPAVSTLTVSLLYHPTPSSPPW